MSLRPKMIAILLASLLTACGGGGGGGGMIDPAGLSVSPSNVTVSATTSDLPPEATIDIRLGGASGRSVRAFVMHAFRGISRVEAAMDSASRGRMRIVFSHPAGVGPGSYTDQVTLKLCYDEFCRDPVPDGIRVIETSYTVSLPTAPEPALPASAAPSSGGTLATQTLAMGDHNVVDAAYSPTRDSIVMISTDPVPALYVYDIATNTETRLDLAGAPTFLALSADGQTLALARDPYKLFHATLPESGVPESLDELPDLAPSDLLLDGSGTLHVLPAPPTGPGIIVSFYLPLETPQFSEFGVPFDLTGAPHPARHVFYAIPPLSAAGPRNIIKYNARSPTVTMLRQSTDDGAHPGCGRLWISEAGSRLYTACGAVFRASEVAEHDMTYMGGFRFFGATGGIQSLSESVPAGEIAVIETSNESCYREPFAECGSRLNFYDRDTLAAAQSYALPGNLIAGFVFHDKDGEQVYVIGRRYKDPVLPALPPYNRMLRLTR